MRRQQLLFLELWGNYEKLCDKEIDLHFKQLQIEQKRRENAVQQKTLIVELLNLLNSREKK